MSLVGVYSAGDTWMHRLPAGAKLLGLLVTTIAAIWIDSAWIALGLLSCAILILLSTRVRLHSLRGPLRFVTIAAVGLGVFMWWQQGGAAATVTVCRLFALVLLAWSVSLTTRVSDMLSTLLRALGPLRRCGVNVDAIALTIALTMRSIPLLTETVHTAQQARLARGSGRSLSALGVPVVVRSARIAEHLGDALLARGYDPDERRPD